MKFLFSAYFLATLGAGFVLMSAGSADARVFCSGRTLGNSITVIGKAPRLDRQMLAGLDLIHANYAHPISAIAQQPTANENIVRALEAKGFSKVTGLVRRGDNYVFQALDSAGVRVSVVMDAETGEIVGLSRVMPKKK